MRGRLAFWLQLASLAATGWLLWQPVLVTHWPHDSPFTVLMRAMIFALVACLAGGLITVVLYLVLRQDQQDVIHATLRTSAVAVWFAPAVILLTELSPAAAVAALVLVVNATRVLYAQWRVDAPAPAPAPPLEGLFARFLLPRPSHWKQLAPGLAASLCAQTGVTAILLRRPALAGLALAMSAATITVFAQSSRALESPRPPSLPRSVLGLLLTLVLAIGLTVGGMMPRFGGRRFGMGGDGGRASAPTAGVVGPPGQSTPIPTGTADSGFFGVILWPEIKPYATLIAPMPQTHGGLGPTLPPRPMSIPFSGEYWMFRWPFAHPPQNSYFQRGNPADLSFSTTDHRALQMEAHHKLEQAIAVDCCSSIQVEVRNADRYPRTITLELYLVDSQAPRQAQVWAGRAAILSQPAISGDAVRAVPETLNFPMPDYSPIQAFDEFKLIFTRDRRRMDKSAKVAIERFVLVPR
jgi:hypothetical protein